jgi:monoamine oxidase
MRLKMYVRIRWVHPSNLIFRMFTFSVANRNTYIRSLSEERISTSFEQLVVKQDPLPSTMEPDDPSADHHIVIIGAGLSGLGSALRIIESRRDVRVTILEARTRAGGRTHTVHYKGAALDMGAGWIGPTHTGMLALATRFKLELTEQFYEKHNSNDARLTECIGFRTADLSREDGKNVHSYVKLIEKLSETLDPRAPWKHRDAELWDNMSVTEHIRSYKLSNAAEREINLFAETAVACIPSETSFLFFLFNIKSGGGFASLSDGDKGAQKWKVAGGTQQISTLLMKELATHRSVRIHLGHAVRAIKTLDDVSTVTCTNGAEFRCGRIIFGIAPQLVKDIKFHPQLPFGKRMICDYIKPGHATKIFLVFEEAFWLKQGPVSEKHFSELGPINNLYHSMLKTNQGEDYPVLIALITGEGTKEFESLDEDSRKCLIIKQIADMYQYDTPPVHYQACLWGLEEFSGGCYAGVGTPTGLLFKYGSYYRAPIGNFFWGSTETAIDYYGYMEGALRAGYRAADECMETTHSTTSSETDESFGRFNSEDLQSSQQPVLTRQKRLSRFLLCY